ncbi:MAG: hypothetical protein OXU20_41515 [Myxococcales bacterium]|nr:hypothetical protein [Myxococcales bacterium]
MLDDCEEPEPGVEVVKADVGTLWLGSDGITRVHLNSYPQFTPEHARQLFDAYGLLSPGKRVLALVQVGKVRRSATGTREIMAGEESVGWHRGVAFLIRSPVARVLVNGFISLQRPAYPTRVFVKGSREAARRWLLALPETPP